LQGRLRFESSKSVFQKSLDVSNIIIFGTALKVYVFLSLSEIDLDVDDLLPFQVDKLNVIALDYGVQPGAYSKLVEICVAVSAMF
jgi:hypothetical protein